MPCRIRPRRRVEHDRPQARHLDLRHHPDQVLDLGQVIGQLVVGGVIARQAQQEMVERAVADANHRVAVVADLLLVGQIVIVDGVEVGVLGDVFHHAVVFDALDRMLDRQPAVGIAFERVALDVQLRHRADRRDELGQDLAAFRRALDFQALIARFEHASFARRGGDAHRPLHLAQRHAPVARRQIALGDAGIVPELEPRRPRDAVGRLAVKDGEDALAMGHHSVVQLFPGNETFEVAENLEGLAFSSNTHRRPGCSAHPPHSTGRSTTRRTG